MKLLRKRLFRAAALAVVPFIGALLIRLIYFTNKKTFHLPATIPEEPFITAFWHGDLLMQPYVYKKLRKTLKINVMISEHFDGLIIARTMEHFSFGTIHGSSTRSGARVLMQAIRSLKEGYDIGITPDGPKGPRHEVQDGVVIMAQKTGSKVLAFQCVPSAYWQLGSWDRFTIPKPFGRLDFYASEPIDLKGMQSQAARALIKVKLMEHSVDHPKGLQ